ncbi:hypothetical protein ABS71_16400 [bacterium SCN 62-11]|nr:hypothetical protein [Candidatus Eremiobacteraeota bacterium]ODT61971.1 MAG: hypothetical protein ABS71_16400 [bacterium SCN 62-11]
MIFFEDEHGLACLPEELIASIVPAFPDRRRVVTADGTVGYLPGPGECWVNGRFLQNCLDPAHFPHSPADPRPAYQPEPFWSLEKTAQGLFLHGAGDPIPATNQHLPPFCPCGPRWFFHPRSLRRIEKDGLLLENGRRLRVTPSWKGKVLDSLGLPSLQLLPDSLTRPFLREFPFEIATAPREILQRHFPTAATLIANLLWQTLEYRRLGSSIQYGQTHRGYWYRPLLATLERAGLIPHLRHKTGAELLYNDLLNRMIGEDRLFCYRDLGFSDAFQRDREIGARHPNVILLIEKEDLADMGQAAARHFGITWTVTGGVSRLVSTEFFVYALQAVFTQSVRVLVFGDFDPGGRLAGFSHVEHLARFGISCPAGPEFLITPEVFTSEELRLFSRPLSASDGRVDEFVAQTGGIGGQARGIHADWLQPPERLVEILDGRLRGQGA